MKILKKISILILMLSINSVTFADGYTKTRSNCNFYGWKWKARSRVTNLGVPTTDSEDKCNQEGSYPNTSVSNNCAYQYALNNWGYESQYGAVTRWYWRCSRGTISSPLYYNLVETNKKEPVGYENSRVTCKSTTFKPDRVIKEGIDASFTVLGKDLFSSLEIIMWLPETNLKFDDSIPTKEKTFWSGKIELVNGNVNLSGDFPKDCYKLTKRNTSEGIEYNVTISNLIIEAKYPEGITSTDLIEVVMKTDSGVNEKATINNAITNSREENVFNVEVYPNPTTDFINVKFKEQINLNSVKLYNSAGVLIETFEINDNTFRRKELVIDLKSLNIKSGLYYVLLNDNENSQLIKIYYNN